MLSHDFKNSFMNLFKQMSKKSKKQTIFPFTMMLKNKLKLKEQLTK